LYFLDMEELLRYADVAPGSPYHAALVPIAETRLRDAGHGHADFHELLYVVSGSGWHHTNGARQRMRSGTLLLARAGDSHELVSDGDPVTFINIAFPSARWRAFLDYSGVSQTETWERGPLPPCVVDSAGELAGPAADALRNYQRGASTLDLITYWSAAIPLLQAGAASAVDLRPAWLVEACAAMTNEANLQAGLPQLLALAMVSHGHLARTMRQYYGCTPVEFVTSTRLAHAATLLAATTEPVGRVSERCGFSSQSYFSRRFSDQFGVSPRQYRDRARRAVVPQ
jgi:AraC-like DNA-binding protein